MKKAIDWSKAPKGTTHAWVSSFGQCDWEKWGNEDVYHWRKGRGWVSYAAASRAMRIHRIKKPEENTMNTNSLEQNIERMQKELDEMKSKLNEKQKWEPKAGNWFLDPRGQVCKRSSTTSSNNFGTAFQTKQQAEIASKLMRERNRIIQYVLEHVPDWKFEFVYDIHNCYVYYSHLDKAWEVSSVTVAEGQHLYMPDWLAKKLADDLNSGCVVL